MLMEQKSHLSNEWKPKLPKLNHDEMHSLIILRPLTKLNFKYVILNLLNKKSPGPESLTEESSQVFKIGTPPVLHIINPPKIEETLFILWGQYYHIKPDKTSIQKENCWPILSRNSDTKFLNYLLANQFQQLVCWTINKWDLIQCNGFMQCH